MCIRDSTYSRRPHNYNRELKQPRRRRQQKPHKFAYLTMKNSIFARFARFPRFARFARAFFILWHFEDVLVLSMTWNDLFFSCVDDVSICWQMFNFVFLCPKCWFQINSRTVRWHFSSIMTLNKWKIIAEKRSYIFRRRRRVCLNSLIISRRGKNENVCVRIWQMHVQLLFFIVKYANFVTLLLPRSSWLLNGSCIFWIDYIVAILERNLILSEIKRAEKFRACSTLLLIE